MKPTPSDVHVNTPLTNVSIAFSQEATQFVADKIFPNVPVTKQADRYYVYSRADWFRSEAQVRAPSTETAGGGWALDSTPNYYCPVVGLHKDVDDQTRANADPVINMDRDATEYVTQQLMLKRDKDWAAKYFTTGVWSADVTPAALWDTAVSTPIEDIRTRIFAIQQNTGYKPNGICFGALVWKAIVDHPQFLERIKYTTKAIVTEDLVAAVLGLDRVVVAGAVENTAKENLAGSYSYVLGKNALLYYAAPAPSLLRPSAGYTFSWTGYLGAGPQGQRIKRFRMEHLSSDRIEGEMAYDQKVVASELGVFFSAVVS